jgi:hypothetical protein
MIYKVSATKIIHKRAVDNAATKNLTIIALNRLNKPVYTMFNATILFCIPKILFIVSTNRIIAITFLFFISSNLFLMAINKQVVLKMLFFDTINRKVIATNRIVTSINRIFELTNRRVMSINSNVSTMWKGSSGRHMQLYQSDLTLSVSTNH